MSVNKCLKVCTRLGQGSSCRRVGGRIKEPLTRTQSSAPTPGRPQRANTWIRRTAAEHQQRTELQREKKEGKKKGCSTSAATQLLLRNGFIRGRERGSRPVTWTSSPAAGIRQRAPRRACRPGRAEPNDVAGAIFPRLDKERVTGKRAAIPSPDGSANKPSHFLPPTREDKEHGGGGTGGRRRRRGVK